MFCLDFLHLRSEILIFCLLVCTSLSYQGCDSLILSLQVFRDACLSKISLYCFTKPPRSSVGFCTISDLIISDDEFDRNKETVFVKRLSSPAFRRKQNNLPIICNKNIWLL